MMRTSTRFARGHTSPLGKIQPALGLLRLHLVADERVREAAARARKPVLEFVRDYVEAGFAREELEHHYKIALDQLVAQQPKRNGTESE